MNIHRFQQMIKVGHENHVSLSVEPDQIGREVGAAHGAAEKDHKHQNFRSELNSGHGIHPCRILTALQQDSNVVLVLIHCRISPWDRIERVVKGAGEALPAEDVSAGQGRRLEEHLTAERAVDLRPDAVQLGLFQYPGVVRIGSSLLIW